MNGCNDGEMNACIKVRIEIKIVFLVGGKCVSEIIDWLHDWWMEGVIDTIMDGCNDGAINACIN